MVRKTIVLITLNALLGGVVNAAPGMQTIPDGSFEAFMMEAPARGKDPLAVKIRMPAFDLDVLPVTNNDFLNFVLSQPKWQRGAVPGLLADSMYLKHWTGPAEPGSDSVRFAPVTNVSWFAARAYCRSIGKRLPLLDEWEYAARPEAYGPDRPKILAQILEWYSTPGSEVLKPPGLESIKCTVEGICGLHGIVWEWVEDFGSVIATSENRASDNPDEALFCGGGSLGALDPGNYAAFMRFAFRTSLKGDYTIGNLGFRCAKNH